ncbi:hypothetical protein QE152_g13696 [Popillia japonica]|uniref:RNase H type-1 domain-containing protein n=1 Tax=Popillia japonica TaxID=7064 RepID=A0AAW1LAY0_POPJA
MFDYCAIIYANVSDSLLKKIDVVHNKSLRMCMGYLRSTPIKVILAEACELPLHLESAVEKMKSINISSAVNLLLEIVKLRFEVEILWVKAHSEIIGNEMADETEKLGCECMEVLDHFLVPRDICKSLSRSVQLEFQKEYSDSIIRKFYELIQPKLPQKTQGS